MSLSTFITENSKQIIAEWEEFAQAALPGMDIAQARDHVAGMLKAIALDLETPQTKGEQDQKSKGGADPETGGKTSATKHGTDRAVIGYTPEQMVSEFRALRASVLRLWSEAESEFSRANLEEVTRFNEAIDQLLAESIESFAHDIDHAKDLLIAVLGHDLRSPLGAIMMSATSMMVKEGPDWPHLKSATRILNSSTRMDGMIRDLLDFTRTRLGSGIPIVRAEMDMELICRQTIDEITAFHPRCKVDVNASGELHGEWDAGRIGQAMSNLVGNAYQHGSADAPVEVGLHGEPDHVVLTVHNKGPVIPKAQLQEIFNPFRQLKPAGRRATDKGSVGLGLYIAQAIVVAHQGTIEVESTERGATFTVRLPRRAPPV